MKQSNIEEVKRMHEQILWTTVRIKAEKAWGSGTVIYSGKDKKGEWHVYVLTCEHVIHDNLKIETKFDPRVGYDIKKEIRIPCEVEFFYYDKYSICQGVSGSVKADIVAYDVDGDIALLKLRRNAPVEYVATLFPKDKLDEVHVFDEVYAVGAAMAHEPIATKGIINFMNELIDEGVEYWMSNAQIIFGNCLSGDSKVLTENGLEKIKDIKVGTKVLTKIGNKYAFRKVEAVLSNGIKDIYKVKTNRNEILATSIHPLLTPEGWKTISNLTKGDKIRALSLIDTIQPKITKEDARVIGIFLGDGTMRHRTDNKGGYEVGFALFEPKDTNTIKFLEAYFNTEPSIVKNRGIFFYKKEHYEKLRSLGLTEDNCYNKRLPSYIFYESPEVKQALLEGIMETDGHNNGRGEWRIELSNKELIEDIKTLAQTLGYDTNGIYSRERMTNMGVGKSYSVVIYPWDIKLVSYDTIKEITFVGKEETYDLRIEDTHNFIANGLIVHNSGGAIFRYSLERDRFEFLGIPARIAINIAGFSADAITHMGYFVPINRVYKMLDDNFYQFIYDKEYTIEKCDELREEYRKEQEKLLLAKYGGKPKEEKKKY